MFELFEKQHRGTQKTTRTPNIAAWSPIVDFRSQSNISLGPLILVIGDLCDVSDLKNVWTWSLSRNPLEQILEKCLLKKFENQFFQ